MSELFRLTYVSTVSRRLTDGEVAGLAEAAAIKNKRLGITGLLLFNGTNFMQTLEGPKDLLLSLYEQINRDERHTGLICIHTEDVKGRVFDGWALSYRGVNGAGATPHRLGHKNGFAWQPTANGIPEPLLTLYTSFNALAK